MYRDKKSQYIVSLIVLAILLMALFVDLGNSRIVAACLLIPLTVAVRLVIRKRSSHSVHKREALLLSTVLGVLYVVAIEMTGLIFGFYKNPYFVSPKLLLTAILPLVVMIIATELLRTTWLEQKNTFSTGISFVVCLLAEVLACSNIAGITTLNQFMDVVGMTLFPAISANVFYHYTAKQFGMLPNVAFRLITTLYVYFTHTVTSMADALQACIKILVPFVLFIFYSALFSKKKKNAVRKESKLGFVATALSVAVVISVAMLISCQFRFGAIVIATGSMTGEINKGDVIVYERYDDQTIREGQVIVFSQHSGLIIHRVIRIDEIGGEVRYYTKGDANTTEDSGYRTDADIVGLTDFKIAYVGYPTLWLHELLEAAN